MLPDIKIDTAVPTMRGKQLTSAQEAVLWSLYVQHAPDQLGDELPKKKFWCELAGKFGEQTGRSYSWLSVKRRIVALLSVSGVPVDWRPERVRSPILDPGSPEVAAQSESGLSDDGGGKERPVSGLESVREEHEDLDNSPFSQRPTVNQRLAQLQSSNAKPTNTPARKKRTEVVSKWLKKNHSTPLPDGGDDIEPRPGSQSPCPVRSKSSAMTRSRARSRSPQSDRHPVYRNRSPSSNRQTEHVSRRLQGQLVSARNPQTEHRTWQIPDLTMPDMSPESHPQAVIPERRSPLKSNNAHDIFEGIHLAPHKRGRPRKAKNAQLDTSASASSDDEDDLPQTPVRILRRRKVAKSGEVVS